ncbi:MAG: hypothetical protein AABO57_28845 [Acidobacteriota bacterium]
MKPKHHFWSSLAAGGALYWATGSSAALAGSMIGGFLIDADHVIDQWWSMRHGAPFRQKPAEQKPVDSGPGSNSTMDRISASLVKNFRPRKLLRLPLIFHSYELLALITVVTLNSRTPLLIGLLSGYVLHLALDIFRHHHEFRSPLFYLLTYRLAQGFRRDQLIKPEYL